jgi:PPOX class probable F420-dependent enzyme
VSPELERRLREERIVWLATVRPDGRPHLVPIWFAWHDDRFWICTTSSSVKARNLEAEPRASVSLEGDPPVVAEGTATVHRPPFPDLVAEAFLARFDWDIRLDDAYDALVELPVARWTMRPG